ncbi:hypothetical protein L1887_19762 [Cichorium endivia]|nr:hypothetical protein L1887_19762 [Cichorium endivia]
MMIFLPFGIYICYDTICTFICCALKSQKLNKETITIRRKLPPGFCSYMPPCPLQLPTNLRPPSSLPFFFFQTLNFSPNFHLLLPYIYISSPITDPFYEFAGKISLTATPKYASCDLHMDLNPTWTFPSSTFFLRL